MAAPDPSYRRLRTRWSALHPWDTPVARGIGALSRTLRVAGIVPTDALFFDGVASLAAPASGAVKPEALSLPESWQRLGYALHLRDGSSPGCPPPNPAARARDALPAMARWQLARVTSLLEDAAADRNPEDLHQLRIALRRGRTVLRLLDPDLPEVSRSLRLSASLVSASGAVRDLDVSESLLRGIDLEAAAVDPLRAVIARRRREALATLKSLVAAPGVHAELLQLVRPWSAARSPRGDTATVARHAWKKARDRLRDELRADLRQPEAFHEVRRRARRLRDVIDVFGHALPARRRRWRGALAPLHSLLGELQDIDSLLGLLPPGEAALGPGLAVLDQRRTALLASLAAPLVELVSKVG